MLVSDESRLAAQLDLQHFMIEFAANGILGFCMYWAMDTA